MKIEGSHLFKSPGEKVWNCLIDPQVLARCIPGCEKLELAGEDSYNAVLKIGIGALKGTFISHIRLQDRTELPAGPGVSGCPNAQATTMILLLSSNLAGPL